MFEELPGDGPQKQLQPRAERLVYRKPGTTLNLTCEPDKSRYVPGDPVNLMFKATNEKHEPAPAIAMVGVVNKSVVTMADEKTFRTMPTHFLLTSEVQRPEDLEHADVLLGSHPKAAAALDLLLGTQGWRRFVGTEHPTVGQREGRRRTDFPGDRQQPADRGVVVRPRFAVRPGQLMDRPWLRRQPERSLPTSGSNG